VGASSLAYIQGEARGQQTLFPSTLDELIPADHVCRVIEAFVDRLEMEGLMSRVNELLDVESVLAMSCD
jgi:hypothetical protein